LKAASLNRRAKPYGSNNSLGGILIRPSTENAAKLISLPQDFGFGQGDFAEADFTTPEQMVQLGRPPKSHRFAYQHLRSGNRRCFRTKVSTEMEGLPVFVLSKELLIQNKRAVGRPQHIADLETLES
jgi:hypothetical protein